MNTKSTGRNRTIVLSAKEEDLYASKAWRLSSKKKLTDYYNKIIWNDTFYALKYLPDNFVDLMIVDPPYNLTKNFGKNTFRRMDLKEYSEWFERWLKGIVRLLKPNASLYICSDWRSSIVIPEIACKYFILQNRITWEREKGRAALNNWKNCLEDIWFFTKSEHYKFNLDNVKMQKSVIAPYRDKKGRPKDWNEVNGQKIRYTAPSNIWTDITIPFWSMKENTEHPTQKPEKLLAKLILASSDMGDVVFDPFVGSGTTAVVAKKLNRNYLGIEREKKYVALTMKRLEMADNDQTIQGYDNGIFKSRNSESV